MGTWSWPEATGIALRKQAPIEEREKRSLALHHGIMLMQQGQGGVVKKDRGWSHEVKLLSSKVNVSLQVLCL
jgi:hypothetical protein